MNWMREKSAAIEDEMALRQRRLPDARYIRQQNVAAGEEGDKTQVNHPVLAHHDPAHGAEQPLVDLPDLNRTPHPTTVYGYPSRLQRRRTIIYAPSLPPAHNGEPSRR